MTMTTETKFILGIGIVTLGLIAGGVFLFSGKEENTQPQSTGADASILLANSRHAIGNASAPVKIVEFADFQCPACAAAQPIVKKTVEQNKDKVYFVFRHYPLSSHQNAKIAAQACEAAGKQDKFCFPSDR